MRSRPGLGATNLVLVLLYFAPVWATEALRVLRSPYGGFEDRAQAGAASAVRQVFDLGLDGLLRTSHVLAGAKLVMAVAFLAYLIEFARAAAVGRELDRATLNLALLLAVLGTLVWAVPALALDDGALVRHLATQVLLVAGAVVVVMVERLGDAAQACVVRQVTPASGTVLALPLPAASRTPWLPLPAAARTIPGAALP